MRPEKPSKKSRRAGPRDAADPGVERLAGGWSRTGRMTFRFAFLYLGLFCLATQISGSMLKNLSFEYRGLGLLPPLRQLNVWVAEHVFGVTSGLEVVSGGEPLIFWVQASWLLAAAAAGAAIWSLVDRERASYDRLHAWFRVFVRFALAASMFEYGMTKLIPNQFPAPSLATLVTPTGDLTLSALLWTSVGAAPPYQIFTGCVELLGGVLLLVPRTALLGAMISLAAATQVFVLNVSYDIGVKLVSFHLMVLALVLLAPDASRLADFFLRGRATDEPPLRPLFRTPRANRWALMVQIVIGVYLLVVWGYANVQFWQVAGGGRPKSPLYGVWDVEQMSVDGERRLPILNDYDRRWRRVILDGPDSVAIQRTDDSFARYVASTDSGGSQLVLRKGGGAWTASFEVERPAPDRLILDGDMDGHRVRSELRLVGFETFRLLNSPFRWIRPHD